MIQGSLVSTAQALVKRGRGILAADESSATIAKRFADHGIECTPDSRRDYREMLFRAPHALRHSISGVILYDETIRQAARNGTPLTKLIEHAGAIPGIKVDQGVKPLPNFPDETTTEGLDGLRDRLGDYRSQGARFAKWRATFEIDAGRPSAYAVDANAMTLARYAALCQEAGLVPMVEPEVLMDGAHAIERCEEVTVFVLTTLFRRLYEARVLLEGMILKCNMVLPGKKAERRAAPDEVAIATLRALRQAAPAAIGGIAFLSGGQGDIEATANLDAINRLGGPWPLTFSFSRALQAAPLRIWAGKPENITAAQAIFARRAHMNALASQGRWSDAAERKAA
jgi:fructose-bisphosphate aldolase class I